MYYLKVKLKTVKEEYVKALDYIFQEKMGLHKTKDVDSTVIYKSEENLPDLYARMAGMCIALKDGCAWFVDNVQVWKIYSPDEGEEDLIEIFLKKPTN